ncbi:VgrG protein [Salmonella enterica subsp. salamae]|nr:VgrG protein [Salmonella enterica subsp. salamae]
MSLKGVRQNFRIFQQQDIQTISATLLKENGITDWKPWFYEDHPAREFCIQYGETDLVVTTADEAQGGRSPDRHRHWPPRKRESSATRPGLCAFSLEPLSPGR